MSKTTVEILEQIIQDRKSVFPHDYIEKPIPKEIIENIIAQADRAPTHKMTQPWRFKVLGKESRSKLAIFLSEKYKSVYTGEQFKEKKYLKLQNNPNKAPCIIALCMQRDEEERLPEWEEVAALSMAVQNMWLMCTTYDIGCYWSSTSSVIKYIPEFLDLAEGESCLGFLYMGYYEREIPKSRRTPLEEKVTWLD